MQRAASIWQAYSDSPTSSDVPYTAVMQIGPERSRELHRIHLELRDIAKRLTRHSGVSFRDTIGISPQVDIVEAYAQLDDGETGSDRSTKALDTLRKRIEHVERVEQRFS